MKKIFSYLFLILLMPCIFMMNGCGDEGYKLSNLSTDYQNIANGSNILVYQDNELKFNYDNYTDNDTKYINTLISTRAPFSYLNHYNYLFDNTLAFVHSYIDVCSNDSLSVSASLRNEIKDNINDLDYDIDKLEAMMNSFADYIKLINGDIALDSNALFAFSNILNAYNDVFDSAIRLSDTLEKIYFFDVLNEDNIDYSKINIDKFEVSSVVNMLDARVKSQISHLTANYLEMNILDSDIANDLTSVSKNYGSLDLTEYKSRIQKIRVNYDVDTAIENALNNKVNFYNKAVELYNIQEALAESIDMYLVASKDISYVEVKVDSHPTTYETMCAEIIDSHHDLLIQYNNVLREILNLMGV